MYLIKRYLAIPLGLLATGGFTVSGYAQQASDDEARLESVSCLVEPGREATLSSHSPGVIDEILVDAGDSVEEGERLFTLRRDTERASLELERERVDYAARTVQRNQQMIEKGMLSDSERDEINTELRLARRQAALARAQLEDRVAEAPFSGVVSSREAEEGEYIDATPVLELSQLDPLRIQAVLPATAYGRLSEDDSVSVQLETPVDERVEARVEHVDGGIDPTSGTLAVEMVLDNPESAIPAGINCRLL
jgi:membrane fusion protein, multidrug efflux system